MSVTETPTSPATGTKKSLLGVTLGQEWTLVEQLGRGGIGHVYEALHNDGKRRVAVKLLRKGQDWDDESETLVERFYHEAQILRRLQHPGIIDVYDFGFEEDIGFYLVMELLKGQSLLRYMQTNTGLMPWKLLYKALSQVCDAMGYAHKRDIVHRDLKPEHIFLLGEPDEKVRVKVFDFGIARFHVDEEQERLTQQGVTLGTPRYLSPEQTMGANIDHRSDIYTLSIILFELLTRRRVFQVDGAFQLMTHHAYIAAPSIAEARPDLQFPPALVELVSSGLHKDPNERPQDMEAFRKALFLALRDKLGQDEADLSKNRQQMKLTDSFYMVGKKSSAKAPDAPESPSLKLSPMATPPPQPPPPSLSHPDGPIAELFPLPEEPPVPPEAPPPLQQLVGDTQHDAMPSREEIEALLMPEDLELGAGDLSEDLIAILDDVDESDDLADSIASALKNAERSDARRSEESSNSSAEDALVVPDGSEPLALSLDDLPSEEPGEDTGDTMLEAAPSILRSMAIASAAPAEEPPLEEHLGMLSDELTAQENPEASDDGDTMLEAAPKLAPPPGVPLGTPASSGHPSPPPGPAESALGALGHAPGTVEEPGLPQVHEETAFAFTDGSMASLESVDAAGGQAHPPGYGSPVPPQRRTAGNSNHRLASIPQIYDSPRRTPRPGPPMLEGNVTPNVAPSAHPTTPSSEQWKQPTRPHKGRQLIQSAMRDDVLQKQQAKGGKLWLAILGGGLLAVGVAVALVWFFTK